MKVVLDSNVWLSGIFWKGEAYNLINRLSKLNIKIMISKDILLEINEVLNREAKFQRFLVERNIKIKNLMETILKFTVLVVPKEKFSIIKEDPKDNKFLELAYRNADYIITYDKHLLKLKRFNGIKIVKPKDFLGLM